MANARRSVDTGASSAARRSSSGSTPTAGASATPASRSRAASRAISSAWRSPLDEPPSTATWTSVPSMTARPGGLFGDRIPTGSPALAYSSSLARRSTSRRGSELTSDIGTDDRRSAVITKCTPTWRPSATRRVNRSSQRPASMRSWIAWNPA